MSGVQRITPDDWAAWRALRVRALTEDPQAFASSTGLPTGHDDDEPRWRGRVAAALACFVAHDEGVPTGMVAADPDPDGEHVVLASMWVAPEARRRGVGRALVDAVLGLADGRPVRLRVMSGNDDAVAVYEAAGFVLDPSEADDEGCRGMRRPADVTP